MSDHAADVLATGVKALQYDMLVAMTSGLHHAVPLSLFCKRLETMLQGVVCSVIEITSDHCLHLIAAPSLHKSYGDAVQNTGISPRSGWGIAAIALGTPVASRDVQTDPSWADCRDLAADLNIQAAWSTPIKARDGTITGAIVVYFNAPREISDAEHGAVSSFVDLCAVAIETTKAREKLKELTFCDSLTGLGNRSMLQSRLPGILKRASEANLNVGIFYIDLDNFRAVNDLHGQATGDILIGRVAHRLRSIGAQSDLIVRMGGDEFIIVMTCADAAADFGVMARRVGESIAGTYVLESGAAATISASVGVARFPGDGRDEDELIAHAETALHCARKSGRSHFVFSPEMHFEQQRRRILERDANLAGESGQLAVVYQPQADARSSVVDGFEALLRWKHPEFGFISPGDFIPIAEQSGAIYAMGAFVLHEACREAASWPVPLRVAVNVSPAQIMRGDFAQLVKETLQITGLKPERLEVEVTESLFLQNPESALLTLRSVKDLGVSVALDDFGTGYSSLSTLRAFPFDRIKIDRSFVFDMIGNSDAAAIVNSVVGLGRALGLAVVAEGVENQEQLNLLRLLGCGFIQGYLFGKPLPAASYTHLTGIETEARKSLTTR